MAAATTSTPFSLPVTAAQVGTYFVGQYYQMLQTQPDFVHQFYTNASTMLRIHGNTRETATAMLQIHQLTMSLNYTGIEIKTAHSLESWNGGVLVMVSGSVNVKGFNGRKKFMETFFLAPQEKGYFVLNDIFHYVDEEQILQHPFAYLPQTSLDSNLHSSAAVREQVPSYMLNGDIQSREFARSPKIEHDGPANNYNYQKAQFQQVPETDKILENHYVVHSNGSLQGNMNSVPDSFSPPLEEPVMEPQRHTYASIVAKAQSTPGGPSPPSINKPAPSELQHVPEISNSIEKSGMETFGETTTIEEEVSVLSVYVKNVPSSMAASEIGEEFKKFGKLKPDGVAIRTRKDIDACYAFVEFEDISGVQNAIKASTVQIRSHQLYIEGRRPNRGTYIRGGRPRGGGRVSSYEGTPRRRFSGRDFNQEETNRDYNKPSGNGFYKQAASRKERGFRNGQISSE